MPLEGQMRPAWRELALPADEQQNFFFSSQVGSNLDMPVRCVPNCSALAKRPHGFSFNGRVAGNRLPDHWYRPVRAIPIFPFYGDCDSTLGKRHAYIQPTPNRRYLCAAYHNRRYSHFVQRYSAMASAQQPKCLIRNWIQNNADLPADTSRPHHQEQKLWH